MADGRLRMLQDRALANAAARAGARRSAALHLVERVHRRLAAVYRSRLSATTLTRMYTALIVSTLLFPLHERLKGHDSGGVRRELEESQWWRGRDGSRQWSSACERC